MTVTDDPEWTKLLARFEEMGEIRVRDHIARGLWNPRRQKAAEHWLTLQEESRQEHFSREDRRIAKSAKKAAWIAAIMAMIANVIAIAAVVIGYLALVEK